MRQCLWCREPVTEVFTFSRLIYQNPSPERLCTRCSRQLAPVADETEKCTCCNKKSVKKLCSDCKDWKTIYPEYDFRHESLYYYNDFACEILKKYKIAGDCELSLLFAGDLQECFRHFPQNSLIIPIPVSAASHLKRGFNQVEILLENAGIRFSSSLENVGRGEKQSKKNREERMRTAQPFWVKPDFEGQIHGRPVVLVDDLYTTGRTLFHAADALKALSPSSVQSFSLFR